LSSYRVTREALGARLRALRLGAERDQGELAQQLGWSQSKVSRIETGSVTPSEADVRAWGQAVNAPAETIADLVARLGTVKSEYSAWRRQFREGTRSKQQDYIELEATTARLRVFEPILVAGLLQTAEYARYRLADVHTLYGTPDDVAEGVRTRMQRQQVLYDQGKRFEFLLLESALRLRVCPAEVLRGQLGHLLALSTLSNVELGVIPADSRLATAPMHGFWIFDDELVLVETIAAELMLREPEEIALYGGVFDTLREAASFDDEMRLVLAGLLKELAGSE
jgi:transcriptional regulator with XRE-family HTH domain